MKNEKKNSLGGSGETDENIAFGIQLIIITISPLSYSKSVDCFMDRLSKTYIPPEVLTGAVTRQEHREDIQDWKAFAKQRLFFMLVMPTFKDLLLF